MATTSLWRVKANLGRLVDYAENTDKTVNPDYEKKSSTPSEQEQWLTTVIAYAMQDKKTEGMDERTELMKRFVTGINCCPETARDEMMATKAKFYKPDGTIAYHGYQSFAPGESTPEQAHEIGVKLAKRLWGDKYEVVVATHLDKTNHLHCHFVLNTVSFVDGRKFYRSAKDYYNMQKTSDALCREYGLSVIDKPQGKTKHYSEWNAEQKGQPTYRNMVKNDIDSCIRRSMTERQFFEKMHKLGYEIKSGKDITVRAFGRERGIKLKRNFGDDYSIEGIRRRILAQTRPEAIRTYPEPEKQYKFKGVFHKPHRKAGLRALYFYYSYRLGEFQKKREPNPKQVYYIFREDIRYIRRLSEETRLLVKHKIDTDVQLNTYKDSVTAQMAVLVSQRNQLRSKLRSISDVEEQAIAKSKIGELSKDIGKLRREVSMCDEIMQRSIDIENKLKLARDSAKSERKEPMKNEPFRRRR
jgi:hypothetical protein